MRRFSLSDVALARPVTVGMLLVAVLVLGVIGATQMPLAFLPRRVSANAWIRVSIARTSPEVLERDVVRPLEEEVAGIRDLERIQVGTGTWGVRMNLEFEPGTDLDARKLELRDRIERVRPNLPEFVQRVEMGTRGDDNDDPVMEMLISSGTDLSQDYYLIEEKVVRALERVPGVARVDLQGVTPHELEIAIDVEDVSRAGVSLQELSDSVRQARQGRSLGVLRPGDGPGGWESGIRAPAREADPQAFAELPLRRSGDSLSTTTTTTSMRAGEGTAALPTGPPDRGFAALGEVAEVSVHPEENRDGKTLNGRHAVSLEIFAAAGASTVEVTQRVRAEVERVGQDPALDGIELLVVHDQGKIILQTLDDLRNTGLWGGLLAFLVLLLFLHRWTTTFAAAICIPLAVTAACAVLFLRGSDLDCIVMLGLVLAVGMLIDNAVVIVEAIAAHSRRGEPPLRAAKLGAREVGFATIASTLSTVIVFIPLQLGEPTDRMAAYLRPLGSTVAIGLVASLVISQTAVPLLMGRLLAPKPKPVHHPVLDRLAGAYAWVIQRTLRWPRLSVLVGLGLAVSVIVPGAPLLDAMKLGDAEVQDDNMPILLEMAGSRGSEKIGGLVEVVEQSLLARKDEVGIASVSCAWGDFWGNCRAYPSEPFQSEKEAAAFKARVRDALPDQPGVKYRLGERRMHWRDNNDPRVVEFALRGEDMAELMTLSQAAAAHLEARLTRGDRKTQEPGTYDFITTPYEEGAVELHIHLDRARLRTLGLAADDVARRVSLAFQGLPLGSVRGPRGEIQLRLSVAPGEGEDAGVAELRDLRIPVADGQDVPLGGLATIELASRPFWIQRVDRQTEIKLQVHFFQADPRGHWELVEQAMADFPMPPGYGWGRGTQWRHQQEAGNEMLVNLGLCLLLVYAVMASLFESFLQPLGILVTCLLGCFGAPWALWLTETTLDTTAIVGFFILIGIVVNNGIMLVDRVTQLRAQGQSRDEALRHAGRDRIRPILMTMVTTILGLVPMLIHHPTLAGVYYHSIAIVIAGGLTSSTILTLVFLPAAYAMLEDLSTSARRGWRAVARRGRR
ncbi:efflux RND transporter permease subunit [Paraliomyxa miuraensis]|uniref:efflux RND transporter permease subunit n=1 Tax=Paraliomyxa miuraensis TaxID=376150 RepID=UPI00225575BB|nr:efflux RND transporter permease subunit [Paraliomyxa miuraensis]MCX4247063.1 efflux RND transporter permease subunit [Paraliomyxa miuraensis]